MPRQVAPPPSDEFQVVLAKPFSGQNHCFLEIIWKLKFTTGTPTLQIEVIGEKNRSASIRRTESNGSGSSSEKKGDVPQ